MSEHFDAGNFTVIVITFTVFTVALFTKGITQDLLLELGVFLVSVKLIMMAHKNNVSTKRLFEELQEVKNLLAEKNDRPESNNPR